MLTDLVAACAAMKAHVVAADPQERTGLRATLNLGHTLAHALESVGGYELLHGEAVAVGLVFAGALAGALERIDADAVDRYRNIVSSLDLPTAVPGPSDRAELIASMQRDKKSVGGLTFVLPGPLGLETVHDPDARALDVAFAAVGVAGCGRLNPCLEPSSWCRGPISTCSVSANLRSTAHHAGRSRRPRHRDRGAIAATGSSTCSRTTKATSSTPSTMRGGGARRSSSTPARSPTTRSRSPTRSPRSKA